MRWASSCAGFTPSLLLQIMNERVHACLNGEISRDRLSPAEREQLRKLETALGAVVRHLHAQPVPDLTRQIMERLPMQTVPASAGEQSAVWERLFAWLWAPRPIRVTLRPAYALAGVLLALTLPLALREVAAPTGHLAVAEDSSRRAPPVYVQFRLEAPGARHVALAGSFTEWQPNYILKETSPGVWTALVPLRPGVHDYAFVVDGEHWIADPHALQVADDFGGVNSRISLPPLHGST